MSCHKCKIILTDEAQTAYGKMWHSQCFRCNNCNKRLDDKLFHIRKQCILCTRCFQMMYKQRCSECSRSIKGIGIRAQDVFWHPICFRCTTCRINLSQKFYLSNKKVVYCATCFQRERDEMKHLFELTRLQNPEPSSPKSDKSESSQKTSASSSSSDPGTFSFQIESSSKSPDSSTSSLNLKSKQASNGQKAISHVKPILLNPSQNSSSISDVPQKSKSLSSQPSNSAPELPQNSNSPSSPKSSSEVLQKPKSPSSLQPSKSSPELPQKANSPTSSQPFKSTTTSKPKRIPGQTDSQEDSLNEPSDKKL